MLSLLRGTGVFVCVSAAAAALPPARTLSRSMLPSKNNFVSDGSNVFICLCVNKNLAALFPSLRRRCARRRAEEPPRCVCGAERAASAAILKLLKTSKPVQDYGGRALLEGMLLSGRRGGARRGGGQGARETGR